MSNMLINSGKKVLIAGGKAVGKMIAPNVMELGAKIGNDFIEKQKSLVKIPDLKDVLIDEAIRVLKDELNMIPSAAVARPSVAYVDESENVVVYSEPKFGARVNPKTAVKVYYITHEVVEKSRALLESKPQEFGMPRVIGISVYEAREDLAALGLRVTEKLEKPDIKFADKEEDQVIRVTYPDNKKIGAKLKTGDRVWLYYVNEAVVSASNALKAEKNNAEQERLAKIKKVANDMKSGIYTGAKDNALRFTHKMKNPLAKKHSKKREE